MSVETLAVHEKSSIDSTLPVENLVGTISAEVEELDLADRRVSELSACLADLNDDYCRLLQVGADSKTLSNKWEEIKANIYAKKKAEEVRAARMGSRAVIFDARTNAFSGGEGEIAVAPLLSPFANEKM